MEDEEREYEKGLAELLADEPDFEYTTLSRAMFDHGYGVDYDVFDIDTWDEELLEYSDNMKKWSFSIEKDPDMGFCICISPTNLWLSDESWIVNSIVYKYISPFMPVELHELSESTYAFDDSATVVSEASARKALLALGLSEMPAA